jgi:8-oxo-dGTP pyrophosphatase MutT (NUDIX family)
MPTIPRVERRQRVVVYVERGRELLVFEHRDHPEARTQVPAGGVDGGEDIVAAVAREVAEETGVTLVSKPRLLGTHDHLDGLGRPATSHFFRMDAPPDVPDRWEHVVTGRGEDADLVFLCRFDAEPELWPVQAVFRT